MAASQIIERIAGSLCLLAVGGSAIYVAEDLHKTQLQIRGIASGVSSTLESVNRPCGTFDPNGLSIPCGTLAEVNKAMVKAQDISVTLQRQVRQSSQLVDASTQTMTTAGQSLARVADALTETAHSASGTLQEAQTTIKGIQPLESAATLDLQHLTPVEDESRQSLADFDALLTSKDLTEAIHHINDTADQVALISDDLHIWSHPILNPDPCTNAKCRWGRGLSILGNYLGIGANGGKVYQLFQPTPVKLVH